MGWGEPQLPGPQYIVIDISTCLDSGHDRWTNSQCALSLFQQIANVTTSRSCKGRRGEQPRQQPYIRDHRHNVFYIKENNNHWKNSKYKRHNRNHYHYRNQDELQRDGKRLEDLAERAGMVLLERKERVIEREKEITVLTACGKASH